jgi:hypothetical protein
MSDIEHHGKESVAKRREVCVALLLLLCVGIICAWEIISARTEFSPGTFELTASDFAGFKPSSESWTVRSMPLTPDPLEPNIAVYEVRSQKSEAGGQKSGEKQENIQHSTLNTQPSFAKATEGRRSSEDSGTFHLEPSSLHSSAEHRTPNTEHSDTPIPRYSDTPILVRLVHGYNMPDCMRIKGYKVELLEDRRQRSEVRDQRSEGGGQRTDDRRRMTGNSHVPVLDQHSGSSILQYSNIPASRILNPASSNTPTLQYSNIPIFQHIQVWRVTSSIGDVTIWITGMLNAGDFSETDIDIRSMAFPRVGIPDNPDWLPRGMTVSGMKHPLTNFHLFLRSKWNTARSDLATFLRLKQPAWASGELLTLVAASPMITLSDGEDRGRVEQLALVRDLAAYNFMLAEFQKWRVGQSKIP